jgi:ketosteroid isomerase-like protein
MASARVKLVVDAIDAYNARDTERLTAFMHPEVDLRPPVMALSGRAYRGRDGVRKWLDDVEESWSHFQIHPLEVTEAGDCVLALTTFRVEGGESGHRFESELGLLCSVRDDLIGSWHGHFSHAAARAEAAQSSVSVSDSGPSDSDSGVTGGGGGRKRSSARPSSSSP